MKANLDELDRYFKEFESRHEDIGIKIDDYKNLCDLGQTYMFFIGHSKSPQQQLPRYEFFYQKELGSIDEVASKILASLKYCGLSTDNDHSFMSEEPMQYLLPSISYHAHRLSKDVGKHIDRETGQWIMARYKNMIDKS